MGSLRLKLKSNLQALTLLATTLAGLLFFVPAQAASVTGVVKINVEGRFLQIAGNPALFKIIPSTTEAVRNLDRLANNDFLKGQGEFRNGQFILQTVDFVGLYHLLGPWHSKSDRALVTFENYNTLSIFNPRTMGYDRVAVFDYSVAPDTGANHWKIFVSGSQSVSIASMRLEDNRMVLQFIDLETGAFEKPLVLIRRVPSEPALNVPSELVRKTP